MYQPSLLVHRQLQQVQWRINGKVVRGPIHLLILRVLIYKRIHLVHLYMLQLPLDVKL